MYKVIAPKELAEIVTGLVSQPSLINGFDSNESHVEFVKALRFMVIGHAPQIKPHATLLEATNHLLTRNVEDESNLGVLNHYVAFVSIGKLVATFCGGVVRGASEDQRVGIVDEIRDGQHSFVLYPDDRLTDDALNVWSFHDIKAKDNSRYGKQAGKPLADRVRKQLKALQVETYAITGRVLGDDDDTLLLVDAPSYEEAIALYVSTMQRNNGGYGEVTVVSSDPLSSWMNRRVTQAPLPSCSLALGSMLGSELPSVGGAHWITGERKTSLIQAALRYMQNAVLRGHDLGAVTEIAQVGDEDVAAIDALCEELSFGREEEHYAVVTLSIGHLQPQDKIALERHVYADLQNVMQRDSGFFMKLYSDFPDENCVPGQSDSLAAIIDWALCGGYEMIEFDADAPRLERFPFFENDSDEESVHG